MLEEQCFERFFRPVIHGVSQKLHRNRINTQKVANKDDLENSQVNEFLKLMSNQFYKFTLSIFSFSAHIRAIRPILFVIVTRVALAGNRNLINRLIIESHKGQAYLNPPSKHLSAFLSSSSARNLMQLSFLGGQTAHSLLRKCLEPICRPLYGHL